MSTDPKNCGAPGHDCLGGSCNTGLCSVETIRHLTVDDGFIRDFDVDEGILTLVGDHVITQGPAIPSASNQIVVRSSGSGHQDLRTDRNSILTRSTPLVRWVMPGATKLDLAGKAVDFDYDTSAAYYYNNDAATRGVYRVPLTGGASTQVWKGPFEDLQGITNDASDVYASTYGKIYRIPKNGSPTTELTITSMPMPRESIATIALTPTRIVIATFSYSAGAECETSKYSLLTVPHTGGAATTLAKGNNYGMGYILVNGEDIYWLERRCDRSVGTIHRRRSDGGPVIDIAKVPDGEERIRLDAQYIYWRSSFDIVRAPR